MTPEQIDTLTHQLLPKLLAEEQRIMLKGRTLTDLEAKIACHSGVQAPEKVKIEFVSETEMQSMINRAFGPLFDLFSFGFGMVPPGTTIGYGVIILKTATALIPIDRLLAHEFTHTAQCERLGLDGFTRGYLQELVDFGYGSGPLEQEANLKMINLGI